MAETISGRIERKYMAHFIDTAFSEAGGTPAWYRLGADLESFSVEMNPETEVSRNILGQNSFRHSGYEPQAEAEPFYAAVGDALFEKLQNIVDNRVSGDGCKTSLLEVHLWDEGTGGTFVAWRQPCYVVPDSYGGDTSGYQIPFTVHMTGERVKGTFLPDGKGSGTFTADA